MENRVWNFNAGPAVLPVSVLEQVRDEIFNYKGTGMSILETSHRTPQFDEILAKTQGLIADFLGIGDDYAVLFLQGGATMQFSMVPMNLLPQGKRAGYILTGVWSKKALDEVPKSCKGEAIVLATGKNENFSRIPERHEYDVPQDLAYMHVTSNNTIYGTEWPELPDTGSVPMVIDMSSDMLSRPVNMKNVGLIYAGAQKNLGPAGVTLVVVRKDMLRDVPGNLPILLDYRTHVDNNSLYNTPPVFAIYMLKLTMEWLKNLGGLEAVQKLNQKKGKLLYGTIDAMPEFYRGTTAVKDRSLMNATFRLVNEELEPVFVSEAKKAGLVGLKGHRSVGGVRASMYNALPVAAVEALVDFMKDFARKNG